jgi:histidine triad (HIT) family protein
VSSAASASCIFCRIVAAEAPAHFVHEDDLVVSFMDIAPVGDGHLLIVPKAHSENVLDTEPAALAAVMAASRRLAHALKRALGCDGIGVHQLNGAAAGQTVFHYHMHLIPRNQGDPIAFHGRKPGDPLLLAENARKIAAALAAETG